MEWPASQYAIPINRRGPKTWFQIVHNICYLVVFLFGCFMINGTQLLFLLPLRLVPNAQAREIYEMGVRYTKGSFALLMTHMSQLFAPTSLRVTFETEGLGKFTAEEIEDIAVYDSSGIVIELCLPKKMVIVANHQVYVDWMYIWCLTYFMDIHRDVLIVLKKSLKHVPVLGWGMQVYRFIFLARNWALDKHYLVSKLAKVGRKAEEEHMPLALIIYPEGTLVSKDTRPVSKKYADKMGIPDLNHTLLPRSTGLHYALRALSPRVPNLKLLDITVAYPGIPPMDYGQSYYTLRSVFMDRVPPPVVHMHLRLFNVATEVPIGDLSSSNPAVIPPSRTNSDVGNGNGNGSAKPEPVSQALSDLNGSGNGQGKSASKPSAVEVDVPEPERAAFDLWVRELWRIKDTKLEEFHGAGAVLPNGSLEPGAAQVLDESKKHFASGAKSAEIPLRLRSLRDALDAYCFFVPATAAWMWTRLRR